MKFKKLPTTIDEQISLLSERGMQIACTEEAKRWLETVGYYRLSAYWLPFETPPTEADGVRSKRFIPEISFKRVCDVYMFDRRLRVLVLEAIERVEIHVRSRWTYHMVHAHGSHAHLEHLQFSSGVKHSEQLFRLARSFDRSKEAFVIHYKGKYTQPDTPPLWAATELMTIGELSMWFQATRDNATKSNVARDLGLPSREILENLLQVIAIVRNICAHHGRLWNRRIVKKMLMVKRWRLDLELKEIKGQKVCDNRLYNVLVALLHLLDKQETDSSFRRRLIELIETGSEEDQRAMGFPTNWKEREIWSDSPPVSSLTPSQDRLPLA